MDSTGRGVTILARDNTLKQSKGNLIKATDGGRRLRQNPEDASWHLAGLPCPQ